MREHTRTVRGSGTLLASRQPLRIVQYGGTALFFKMIVTQENSMHSTESQFSSALKLPESDTILLPKLHIHGLQDELC